MEPGPPGALSESPHLPDFRLPRLSRKLPFTAISTIAALLVTNVIALSAALAKEPGTVKLVCKQER